jgi:hypothetical protein
MPIRDDNDKLPRLMKAGNFFTSWVNINFQRKSQIHVVILKIFLAFWKK